MPDLTALALASRIPTTPATSAWATVRAAVTGTLPGCATSSDGTRYYLSHGLSGGTTAAQQLIVVAADGTPTTGPAAPTARAYARAAWLNGKHYAYGGNPSGILEAYTPGGTDGASGTWATLTTGPTITAHEFLAVGSFLYSVGGSSNGSNTGVSGQLSRYDPTANTWATLTAMPSARWYGVGFVAAGKIYYSGGQDSAANPQTTTYVYDPVAGTWATAGALPGNVTGSGEAYVYGGKAYLIVSQTLFYVLDIASGVWTTGTPGQFGTPLTAHYQGQTFVVGNVVTGFSGTGTPLSMERLDLTAAVDNTPPGWSTVGALAANRYDSAVSTDGTNVYLSHGLITGNTVVGTLSVVNATTGATATGTTDGTPLLGPASAFVNGKHLVIGGSTSTTNGTAAVTSVRAYTPAGTAGAAGTWAAAAALPVATVYASAATVGGSVYVAGGSATYGSNVGRTTFQRYDAAGDTWTNLTATAPLPAGRTLGLMVAVGTKLYYLGGYDASSSAVATVFVYDTVAATWTTAPALPTAPAVGGAAAAGGLVYYTGVSSKALSTYNPTTGVTTATTTPLPTGHGAEAGNLVPLVTIGTRLVVAGGVGTTNVDTFDPTALSPFARRLRGLQQYLVAVGLPVAATAARRIPTTPPVSTWATVGALTDAAPRYQAAVSTDGTRIYLTQGYNTSSGAQSGGYTVTPAGVVTAMTAGATRYGSAGVWCNGRHYSVGGLNASNQVLTTNEYYTPAGTNGATGTWTGAAATPFGSAYGSSAAALGTNVYIAGGTNSTSAAGAAVGSYRYDPTANTWLTLASMPAGRYFGALLPFGGKLYYLGGLATTGSPTTTVFVYDPTANTWTTSPFSLPAQWSQGYATVLGSLFYYGGPTNLTSYDPVTGATATLAALPSAHSDQAAAAAVGSQVFVVAGSNTQNVDRIDLGVGPAYTAAVRNTRSLTAVGV